MDPEALSASGDHLQAGRLLEAKGRVPEAIQSYERAGAYGEAARVLGAGGRYRDAGVMLLRSLPDAPTPIDRLSREQRNDALSAAMWFARGGSRAEAVGLLVALGEHQRAAGLLQMAGRREDAARAMRGEQIPGSPWATGTLHNLGTTGAARAAASGEIERLPVSPRTPPPPPARPAQGPYPPPRSTTGMSTPGTAVPARPTAAAQPLAPRDGARAPAPPRPDPRLGMDEVSGAYVSGDFAAGARSTGTHGAIREDASKAAPKPASLAPRADLAPPRAEAPGPRTVAAISSDRSDGGFPPELAPYLELGAEDPRARAILPDVVRGAWDLDPLHPVVLRFLDRQVEGAVRAPNAYNPAALYALARLFEVHDRVESAKQIYRRLSELAVPFQDAEHRLAQLQDGLAESADGTWLPPHILVAGFHEYAPKPPLADLPPLPLPAHPRGSPSRQSAPSAPPPRAVGPAETGVDDETVPPGGPVPVHLRPQPLAQEPRWSQPDPGARGTPRPFGSPPTRGQPAVPATPRAAPPAPPNLTQTAPVPQPGFSPVRAEGARKSADETMDFDEYVTHQDSVSQRRMQAVSGSLPAAGESMPRDGGLGQDAGSLPAGTVIADRYRVESLLGAGGMAVVYRAMDMELEEHVALKLFLQVVQHSDGLARFRREMKLSRKLTHPNIVRIFEFGVWRGARFITMELLKGDDLEHSLKRVGGPMPIAQALRLSMQAAEGLGAAHKAGVVHRDVKPQNMFVIDEGRTLKIMDFGIAKATDSASISATDVRVGTPRYMSPEQIQGGQEVGPAADLYALGAVMYEMFTGTRLFKEEDLVPLLMCHLSERPTPPRHRNPHVPVVVESVIMRLLEKKPEDRFGDCAELKKALVEAWVETERMPPR